MKSTLKLAQVHVPISTRALHQKHLIKGTTEMWKVSKKIKFSATQRKWKKLREVIKQDQNTRVPYSTHTTAILFLRYRKRMHTSLMLTLPNGCKQTNSCSNTCVFCILNYKRVQWNTYSSCATWSCMREMRGETTTDSFLVYTAGNW